MLQTCTETLHSCVSDSFTAMNKSEKQSYPLDLLREVKSDSVQGYKMLEVCSKALHSCVCNYFAPNKSEWLYPLLDLP